MDIYLFTSDIFILLHWLCNHISGKCQHLKSSECFFSVHIAIVARLVRTQSDIITFLVIFMHDFSRVMYVDIIMCWLYIVELYAQMLQTSLVRDKFDNDGMADDNIGIISTHK